MRSYGGTCTNADGANVVMPFPGEAPCQNAGHTWTADPNAKTTLSGDQGVTVASANGDITLRSEAADGRVQLLGEGGVDIESTDGNVELNAATTAEITAPVIAMSGDNVGLRAQQGSVNVVATAGVCRNSNNALLNADTQAACQGLSDSTWTPAAATCVDSLTAITAHASLDECEGAGNTWLPAGTVQFTASSGDVEIESTTGGVSLDAETDLSISAGGTASLVGATVNVQATGELRMQADTATMTATGTATIQGTDAVVGRMCFTSRREMKE